MTPKELLDATQGRIDWIWEHCPEVLERPVMIAIENSDELIFQTADVYVEEFLIIKIKESNNVHDDQGL